MEAGWSSGCPTRPSCFKLLDGAAIWRTMPSTAETMPWEKPKRRTNELGQSGCSDALMPPAPPIPIVTWAVCEFRVSI
jgi:hypothetical protein